MNKLRLKITQSVQVAKIHIVNPKFKVKANNISTTSG